MASVTVSNDLYDGISEEVRNELTQFENRQRVARGTKLVEAGVRPDHLTILDSGTVETCVRTQGESASLGIMGPGRVFGLHSILSGETPETTVRVWRTVLSRWCRETHSSLCWNVIPGCIWQ